MADETPDLFAGIPAEISVPQAGEMVSPLDLPNYRRQLADLACNGTMVGTSSWKYPGWRGLVYDEARYLTRGKFSEKRFNQACLEEYAQTFPSVCVDAGYYTFPSQDYISGLCAQVPESFKFAFKATDEVTINRFPQLPRFGQRAGTANPNFLNAEMFRRLFLGPLEPHRRNIGPIIFEFSTFHKKDFAHGRDFVAALDTFLDGLPSGWEYGVEIRNQTWLQPEYFDMLRSHNVAHVFNNWTKMPAINDQVEIPGAFTADFYVARFLLKPGRNYQNAVDTFNPYDSIKELNVEARNAFMKMMGWSVKKTRRGYIYINNRLEGCGPETIRAMLVFFQQLVAAELAAQQPPPPSTPDLGLDG